jgi:hypothetical protein
VALSKYEGSIPTPADIPLDQVCALLYNRHRRPSLRSPAAFRARAQTLQHVFSHMHFYQS